MKNLLAVSLLFIAALSLGFVASAATDLSKTKIVVTPFQETYFRSIASDSKTITALGEKIRKNDRSLCPGYQSKDVSTCLKQALRGYKITSATAASLLTELAIQASKKDKGLGYDDETSKLMMLDNVLTILEHIDPSKFAVEQLRPRNASEQATRKHLVDVENAHLAKFKAGTIGLLETKLPEPQRAIASESPWKQDEASDIEERLARAKEFTLHLN